MNDNTPHSISGKHDLSVSAISRTVGCGFLMGAADVIPGVSGGTVALILGIYRRLISAISNVDTTFVRLILSRKFVAAARHIDLAFIASLGTGIACGIAGLASLMHHLLAHHRSLTYAAFCGLILSSVVVVGRRVQPWTMPKIGLAVAAAATALRIVSLTELQDPPDTLWYLFGCGMIGITAMILPGISGAFILVILKRYFYIVDKLKTVLSDLIHFQIDVGTVVPVIVFSFGCLTGLLTFSKFLKWLLSRHEQATIASLCGFMIGAVYCLWPFQHDLTPKETDLRLKHFAHFFPESLSQDVVFALLVFAAAFSLVLVLERLSQRKPSAHKV
jgi:putative membrane protein